jgi:hypothetical protein
VKRRKLREARKMGAKKNKSEIKKETGKGKDGGKGEKLEQKGIRVGKRKPERKKK